MPPLLQALGAVEVNRMADVDETFYDRADAHIHLANEQISDKLHRGKVSASFLYAASRFNAWDGACKCEDAEDMAQKRENLIDYFCEQYRKMLEQNVGDYIENFDRYINYESRSDDSK